MEPGLRIEHGLACTGATYQVYGEEESGRPVGAGTGALCLASGLTDETAADAAAPLPGRVFRSLVRAVSVCGGPCGAASDGTPPSVAACPWPLRDR
ncbi:MAG: hypothetical protein ACRD6R_02665 [Candidatus Polarisedimenticolia bacterium]